MQQRNFSWRKWLVLGLIILFVAMAMGFWSARSRYENRLAQQIWPSSVPQISVVSNASANFHSTVLLLGDSRLAQWNAPQLSGWRVLNAGMGGLTTGQILLCVPKLLDEFHPDIVVLQAGINDLKFLGLRPAMASQIVSLAASNITAIITECEKRHCKVILLETWPAGQPSFERRLIWSPAIFTSTDQLNAQLRKLDSTEKGIRVVDLFKEAGLKLEAGLYRDTLHFKPEVYQQLTPFLEKELTTLNLPAR